VEELLSIVEVFPLDGEVDRKYAKIRTRLENGGTPIGPNDLLIAAQALALGLTLVTANIAEFARVPGLHIENWLA
jgi:tRNA(fMet)-specific endonuclease VapC